MLSNNQISGFCYDAAGNLVGESACPASTYAYNAENQLTSTAGVSYTYDGDGNRVEKSNGTLYWYGIDGNVLDETDLSGNVTNEYVYLGSRRIARVDPSGNAFYYLSDSLGTSRVTAEVPSGSTTATMCYDADFYPFGGERPYLDTCDSHYKFTGKERDSESGLDNFGARYDSSAMGRFMSPDPSGLDLADLTDPQQLNLYSYVRNNPLLFTDPNGLDCVYLNDAGNGIESIDQNSNAGECQQNGGAWAPGTITNVTFDPNSNDVLLGYANQGANGSVDYSQITSTPGQFNPGDWNDAVFNAVGQGTQMAGYFLSTPQRWYDAEQAWMAAHPNIEGALMIGAALAGGGEGAEGEGAGFGEAGEGSAEIPGRPFRGKNASEQAYQHLEQFHGIDPATASERLHNIKQAAGLGPADDVIIGRTGDVYNAKTGERIGSLTQSH